ncbi:MAG: hypothetical protein J7M34_10480, partial [Anaerolineae bacterium]|nr:hypothetical protein [Anaerolineae bacterium]
MRRPSPQIPRTSRPPSPTLALLSRAVRLAIFLLVLGTIAGSGMIAWAHLKEQWADKPNPEEAKVIARVGAPRPLTLDTLEDYFIELYLRLREPALSRP